MGTVATYANNLGACCGIWGLGGRAGAVRAGMRIVRRAGRGASRWQSASTISARAAGEGDFAGARALFERALRIDEAAYGPDHPEVGTDANNLGNVLRAQGDYAGARALFERALRIDEAALGAEHPTVAIRLSNLGGVLRAQGDLAGARALFERALRIGEAALGAEHPRWQLRQQSRRRAAGAGRLRRRAGAVRASIADRRGGVRPGPPHGGDLRQQSRRLVLRAQGDFAGARALFERALRIGEAALGAEHPAVAIRLNNLGHVLQAQGDFAGARALFERALRIFRAALGDEHPSTQTVRQNLESLLQQMPPGSDARSP